MVSVPAERNLHDAPAPAHHTITKRGELLHYRPRTSNTSVTDTANAPVQEMPTTSIRYGGQVFVATSAMSEVFLSHAQRVLAENDAQLVTLLHEGGIELLLIARNIPFEVSDVFRYDPRSNAS